MFSNIQTTTQLKGTTRHARSGYPSPRYHYYYCYKANEDWPSLNCARLVVGDWLRFFLGSSRAECALHREICSRVPAGQADEPDDDKGYH